MKKILFIEDEPDVAEVVKVRLESAGYGFITASDGEEGLKKTAEEKPDLVLLDHFLPKMRGLEVCKRIKADPRTKHIPVIIITASGAEHIEEQCKSAGADGYLAKPYGEKDLLGKIERALKVKG